MAEGYRGRAARANSVSQVVSGKGRAFRQWRPRVSGASEFHDAATLWDDSAHIHAESAECNWPVGALSLGYVWLSPCPNHITYHERLP